ncbi:AAA family ATPase [archaeon]|nr:AAA family ATPase [archaeon]
MDYIIKREESKNIEKESSWLLVYGRRKTGKTFLLRNLCKFDLYYLVKKNLDILSDEKTISLNKFVEEVKEGLNKNKGVVIDEFQRLDESILEEISTLHPKGKLVLSGSSLRIAKKFYEPRSAFLGFFTPSRIGFIKPTNIIKELKGIFKPEKTVEISTFLREPWLIPPYDKEEISKFVYNIATKSKYVITSLVGEIFTEEEREMTKKYDAILSLVGSGIWNTKEIANILYAKRLIEEPSQTHIIQYLKNLQEIDLIENMRIYKSKNNYYKLLSPIANIYYYLDSRYDISNREISFKEVLPTVQKLVNMEIQNFVADLFAELYDGRKEYFVSPTKEIDFIITKRNKPEIIGEVKWKEVKKEDIEKFRSNSEFLHGRKILICKEGYIEDKEIEVMNAKKIVEIACKHKKEGQIKNKE